MERVIDRFDVFMTSTGLNDNKVTVQLNLSKGLIGKSRGKGRDLSRSLIEKILAHYTDLNEAWLLTGQGPMLKSDQPENPVEEKPEDVRTLDRLFALIDDQRAEIKMLLNMLKEKDEKIEELRKELDARKGKTASGAGGSSVANAV